MAKLAFFAAVLVALVALTAAEGDSTLQLQCQRQLQESSLNACRQVVDQQLAVQLPFFVPQSSQLRTGARVQCCLQLQDISRECRATAIRQIVRQYEHQAVVPLRDEPYYPGEYEEQQAGGSYYPGEDEEQQGVGSYYPGEDEEQQGGAYYPSETYPQQEQGWEQQQHQQGQGRQAFPQQQEQWSKQQQQEQGWYRPSQTYQQEQQQGSYRPSQTYRPQQQQQGGQEPHRLRITIYRPARQPAQQEGQGQYCGRQSQQTGFGRFSSPPRFGTEQQAARLRMQLRVVAKARQVAAQLPAMCRLEGSTFSGSQY